MRVLVAVDLRECSASACRWVASRVDALAVDHLIFHHVLDDAGPGELASLERGTMELRRFVQASTGGVPARAGLSVVYSVTAGKPVEEILQGIRTHDIDAVVMGTHGRTGIDRLLTGSVAEAVVRAAPCTVIVVKPHG